MSRIRPSALAVALAITATETSAQAMLEEVIVTATKRAESLQDIPVTVTAFNSEAIQEAGINNAEDLAILTPSLNISSNLSPFNARMTIRGIGTAQTDPALEPSVGMFIDGVFLGRRCRAERFRQHRTGKSVPATGQERSLRLRYCHRRRQPL